MARGTPADYRQYQFACATQADNRVLQAAWLWRPRQKNRPRSRAVLGHQRHSQTVARLQLRVPWFCATTTRLLMTTRAPWGCWSSLCSAASVEDAGVAPSDDEGTESMAASVERVGLRGVAPWSEVSFAAIKLWRLKHLTQTYWTKSCGRQSSQQGRGGSKTQMT